MDKFGQCRPTEFYKNNIFLSFVNVTVVFKSYKTIDDLNENDYLLLIVSVEDLSVI